MAPDLFIPPEHRRVLNVLEGHVGKKNAIRRRELAAVVGMGERQVRVILKVLLEELGRPVCSAYGNAGQAGYYLPANDKEAFEVSDRLKRHALSILRRASVLENITLDMVIASLPRLAREEAA